jgi:hypothetical protein
MSDDAFSIKRNIIPSGNGALPPTLVACVEIFAGREAKLLHGLSNHGFQDLDILGGDDDACKRRNQQKPECWIHL